MLDGFPDGALRFSADSIAEIDAMKPGFKSL
jgi:hypothetical protein